LRARARNLTGKTIRRHADRTDETLPNAFFDDATMTA